MLIGLLRKNNDKFTLSPFQSELLRRFDESLQRYTLVTTSKKSTRDKLTLQQSLCIKMKQINTKIGDLAR